VRGAAVPFQHQPESKQYRTIVLFLQIYRPEVPFPIPLVIEGYFNVTILEVHVAVTNESPVSRLRDTREKSRVLAIRNAVLDSLTPWRAVFSKAYSPQ
jgi:hypothetical protein